MKAKHRSTNSRALVAKARRHEGAADALGQAAERFAWEAQQDAAPLAVRARRMHRVEALKARALVGAARALTTL